MRSARRWGQRAEMEAGRRTLPGVPKYLYGMSVPSWASAGQLPCASSAHCAVCPPPASCLWQTLSVGTAGGPRGWRWWLAAGVWGRGGLAGWPTLSVPPICWCWAGTRPGLPGLWVMAGSSGHRRAAGSRPSAAGATETHSSHLLSSWLGRVFFSCLSFVLFSSCLFHRAGSQQGASHSI